MSTTDGRKQRMERLLKCLRLHPAGLEANQIALKTQLLTEITMDRLYKYLSELEWSGIIEQTDLRWRLIYGRSLKFEREIQREKNKKKEKEGRGRLK